MATLNARMRLLYDKNYTAKGSPMRRYDNPYYIASSQKLLYDILQQQTAKKPTKVSRSRTPPMMATNSPATASPASSAPTAPISSAPVSSAPVKTVPVKSKASERKPPLKMIVPKGGSKGKTGNLRGKSEPRSAGQYIKNKNKPFGKKQGTTTKLADESDADKDDDAVGTNRDSAVVAKSKTKANPQAYIAKQGKIKGHENALATAREATWKSENDALINKKNATLKRVEALQKKVTLLSGKSDPPLLKKLSDAEDQYEKENTVTQLHTKAQPSVTYKKTRATKAEYQKDRAKLLAIDAKNQKELDAEMKRSGGQSSPNFLKIKGKKRYWKARLAELDASNSKN